MNRLPKMEPVVSLSYPFPFSSGHRRGRLPNLPIYTSLDFAESLLEAARLHGENSEPDHEVGDLQTLFVACWSVMSPEQRALVLVDPDVLFLLDGLEYSDLLSNEGETQ